MIAYKQEPKSRPCLLFLHLMTAIRKIIISTFFEYETDIPFIIIIPHSNKGGGFNRKYLYMQGIYFTKKQAL